MKPTRLAAACLLAAGLAAWTPGAALAQSLGGGNGIAGNGFSPPVKGGGVVPNNTLPPPPGLPGAARHGIAAPASKPITDMAPNEALFDAINRGDLGTAQDALSRGADLDGRNVLGMTPLELSVDLSRNDITFLLLSLRGTESGSRPRGSAGLGASAAGGLAGKGTLAAAMAQPRRLSATIRAVRLPTAAGSGLAPASVRYAGADPGAPVPAAGFLGFGP